MRLRLVSVDELQFLTCLERQLWGSKSARFKEWNTGDYLAFVVDRAIAGLAQVSGEPFESKERVWDNGVFPYRIHIKMIHAIRREARPPILGQIRDVLTSEWGTTYGWGIRNQQLLQDKSAETILNSVQSRPNDLSLIQSKLSSLQDEADAIRKARALPKKRGRPRKTSASPVEVDKPTITKQEESEHIRVQSSLIQLGKITGCSVWIASNDRSRLYKGKALGDGCLKSLPNLGLSTEATKRISYIDVIWIRQNAPVCAFEVETTTTVYSGLLRMSDLLAEVPALNIQLFIVAPRDREQKVREELARPTFRKVGLNEYCRFIAVPDLHTLLAKVEDLQGHVQPSILETIALEFDESELAVEQ
jgi:hypothetical protein